MKVRDAMTSPVIQIRPEESVSVAARTLAHYNIGALPVCGKQGKICGVVTDRDIVIRCLAANRRPDMTTVQEIMTSRVMSVAPDAELAAAARMMGKQQIRRLPVVEQGRLCGMVSLGDIASNVDTGYDAADALSEISNNISHR